MTDFTKVTTEEAKQLHLVKETIKKHLEVKDFMEKEGNFNELYIHKLNENTLSNIIKALKEEIE